MVISFRNHHQISYNTKNKIWRELCEIIFPPKIPNSEKQKTYNFREYALVDCASIILSIIQQNEDYLKVLYQFSTAGIIRAFMR